MRWWRRAPEPTTSVEDRLVKYPSNESIDLLVKFERDGSVAYVDLYDTLGPEWGERQPTLTAAVDEMLRRVRRRPRG